MLSTHSFHGLSTTKVVAYRDNFFDENLGGILGWAGVVLQFITQNLVSCGGAFSLYVNLNGMRLSVSEG